MSTASQRKGAQFERDVVDFLRNNGFPHAERRKGRGVKDAGDVAGIPPTWCLELKNEKRIDLAGYMGEAECEAANAHAPYFAAVVKRPRRSTREAYVVMPLWKFVGLMRELAR